MHVELLVEERSAEAALANILPRILPPEAGFRIHPFNGKHDLLQRLPARLRGYRRYLPDDWKIVVLVDADREDCRVLKERLDQAARAAGFATRTNAQGGISPRCDPEARRLLLIEDAENRSRQGRIASHDARAKPLSQFPSLPFRLA